MSDLARAINKPSDESRRFRIGVVRSYTPGASTIQVELDGSVVVLPCVLGPTYVSLSTVLVGLDGRSGGYVLGRFGTAAGDYTPPQGTNPFVKKQTKTILPVDVGSYYYSLTAWNFDRNISESSYSGENGSAFYGDQFTALHADTAQDYSADLTVMSFSDPAFNGQTADLYLMDETFKPLGPPTRHESVTGPATKSRVAVTWPIPTSWVLKLLNGTRGSLGVYLAVGGTPKVINFGLPGQFAAQFAIKITYFG